jgi:Ca2+-binding EF-hand superfamily protein
MSSVWGRSAVSVAVTRRFRPRQATNLRRAVAVFDRNHNGKLEPEELAALMQYLRGSVK